MGTTGTNPRDTTESLSTDRVMRLLASETRRAAIRALQSDSTVALTDLATAISESDGASLERPERIRQRLHHAHLPALETAGVLRYDADDHTVDYLGDDTVESVLSALDD